MPRRSRRHAAEPAARANEQATSQRIQAVYRKILAALQDQRDLRCDLASTRTRALLLDSEYVVLHAEYERSLAARDKLEALSRELARQNKTIDEESEARIVEEKRLREEIVHRFNVAMMEINKKLARQSRTREEREVYVSNLQRKVADLQEQYTMREEHFRQQVHRKRLETRLAEAKRREVKNNYAAAEQELDGVRKSLEAARADLEQLRQRFKSDEDAIRKGERELENSREDFERQQEYVESLQAEVKALQSKNSQIRKQNSSTGVHLKAMGVEVARLKGVVEEQRELERRERAKVEALDKLCKQVTCERSEHHSEILVMQDAWSNLKQEIGLLKEQVGDSNRVFEVLQSIMAREPFEAIEDVINDKLGQLKLATGGGFEGSAVSEGRSSGARKVDPPG